MKIKRLTYYLIVAMLMVNLSMYSLGDPPNPPKPPPPHPELPIDGGFSYLLIAGIAYGVYELTKKK